MNHVYRIVWNHVACTWQAVAECAKGFGKGRQGRSRARLSLQPSPRFSIKPLLAALSLISSSAWAGPQGGQVVAGSATIQQAGNTTTINQSTNRAAIDWTSFSVGKAESVRFNQPSTSAITLNRVTGTESSQILGSMSANGQVFILNPNGVLFGKGAQVNVGGLVASTHGMSNADFMDGNYQLSGNGTGAVINQGKITVIEGGTIALIAPIVKNTGTLTANGGSVLLAAADAVSLKLQDGSLIGYTLDKGSLQALVDNGGVIHAEGGHVVLTAKALDALSKATINHSGIIEAQTVANKNGVVELLGDMQVGEIKLSGKIDASAPNGGDGGFVETSAANIDLNQPHWVSTLSKYGKTGRWLIDPNDFVIGSGGNITAQGLHEDLAHGDIAFATATQGTAGGNGDIFVNEAVSWSSHKLTLSAGRNILINANLTASGSASLALEYGQGNVASGNAANYFINNGAKVTLPAGQNFSTKLGSDGVTDIYTVITSLGVAGDASNTTLQGIKNNLTGKYALGDDIDASATSGWNTGLGWEPIGFPASEYATVFSGFSGQLHGLGHVVKNLTVNRPDRNFVGLFSRLSSGVVRNIGLDNVSASGWGYVGGLVGDNAGGRVLYSFSKGTVVGDNFRVGGLVGGSEDGDIVNSYSMSSVSGGANVGGLVGENSGGLVSGSYSTGSVHGDSGIGGLVGENQLGGIIENSTSSTIVNANSFSGGLVGVNHGVSTTIRNSYSSGDVVGTGGGIGGLVGYMYSSDVINSYSTSRVNSSAANSGGLVGFALSNFNVVNSYWNAEISGKSSSAGGVGKTTVEMKQRGTFTGWDFANTWQIVEGGSYPTLLVFASNSGAGSTDNNNSGSNQGNGYSDQYVAATLGGAKHEAISVLDGLGGILESEDTRLVQVAIDAFDAVVDSAFVSTDPLKLYEEIDGAKVFKAKSILGTAGSIVQIAQSAFLVRDILVDAADGDLNIGHGTDVLVNIAGYTPVKVLFMPAEWAVLAADIVSDGSVSDSLKNNIDIAKGYVGNFVRSMDNIATQLSKGMISVDQAEFLFEKEKLSYKELLTDLGSLNTGFRGGVVDVVLLATGNGASLIKFGEAVDQSMNSISDFSFDTIRIVASAKVLASIN